MQATHTMGFTYNAAAAAKWEISAEDWIGCFCNCNTVTHKDIVEADFAALVTYDRVNGDACPVLVYMRNDVPVAYYDDENEWGYIVA